MAAGPTLDASLLLHVVIKMFYIWNETYLKLRVATISDFPFTLILAEMSIGHYRDIYIKSKDALIYRIQNVVFS